MLRGREARNSCQGLVLRSRGLEHEAEGDLQGQTDEREDKKKELNKRILETNTYRD